mgnify:CR=1 FL=1
MSELLVQKRWPSQHPDRIQLYTFPTPNGIKVSVALEELGLPYEAHSIHIIKGDQHTKEYLTISPNGKIPTLLDPNGPEGKPIALMESVAILHYLAEKIGKLIPSDPASKNEALQWLLFQVGHIGPMFGQFGHFHKLAGEKCDHPYPLERYKNETRRLLGVLEKRLSNREFILDSGFSMVDIAIFPWVEILQGYYDAREVIGLADFPRVEAWLATCMSRPSYKVGSKVGYPSQI